MTNPNLRRSLHFGSAVIDIITLVASEDIERLTLSNEGASFLLLEVGRKVPAKSITTHVGGGACNTAVSLARRGWGTAVLARVGDDLNASAIRAHLATNSVQDRLITSPQATGTAVMVASHDRNASIFVHRGANEHLCTADMPDMAGHDLVYIAPLSSGSADIYPDIVARAVRAGAMVSVNPGIRQLTTRLQAFADTLPAIDVLSVNRVEAEALIPAIVRSVAPSADAPPSNSPPLMARGLSSGGLHMGLADFLNGLRAMGPRWISLTDGTDGAYLAGANGIWFQPALPAEVAGTAGAGDAFCSTLSAALVEGESPESALLQAGLNAASVVSHVDTTAGLLAADEMAARSTQARVTHTARRLG